MPRQLAVCVDDFGLHDGVNQAVFDLLALRRITAVSCLVDGPSWASGAAALQQAVGQGDGAVADVGLHLNFTEWLDTMAQSICPPRALGAVIRACYLRQGRVPDLVQEIERQWSRFEAVWGRAPDFVDGHQHVHQLPQIREALMLVLARRYPHGVTGPRPWIRQCRSPGWAGWRAGISLADTVKAAIIATLGARVVGRLARQLGLRHSSRLLGVYPFDAQAHTYLQRWQTWLRVVQARGDLLMCHPAAVRPQAPPWPDVIAASRHMEHAVLTGPAFGQLLSDAGIRLVRLSQASS
jgi:predicted glycoside hydrolase/deacetylase ChbG (UPF0249 family)